MAAMIQNLLLMPETFFAEKMSENESIKIPAFIVLINGIIGAFSGYLVSTFMLQLFAGALPEGMDSLIGIFGAVGALLGVFIFWLVWTVVFYAVSALLKGSGSFKRTLEFVGYGYLPMTIGSFISLIALYITLPTIQLPVISNINDPTAIQELQSQFLHSVPMTIVTIIGLLFMVWSANLWIFGMMEARSLSRKNALITVLIPVALYIIWSLSSFLVI